MKTVTDVTGKIWGSLGEGRLHEPTISCGFAGERLRKSYMEVTPLDGLFFNKISNLYFLKGWL